MKRKSILFGLCFLIIGVLLGSEGLTAPAFKSQGMEDAVINVVKTAGRAAVSISTEHTTKVRGGRNYYFSTPFGDSPFSGEGDPFGRFFDDFFGELPDREFKQKGLGSGVIIDADGYILTNEHVVGDADKIKVTLPDGREFKGELKGRDPRSDLAIIKVNARNLPVATLGESDSLQIGQWVVAIGNPFGFAMQNPEPTVTAGVISALHRTLGKVSSRDRDYNDLIQTDAAINPGNSGGPLVNLKGEVVGINVAIFSTSGGYQGIGFAIPINSAKRIISRLIEGKKILYGWLGVTVQDLTEDLAGYFSLPDKKGVLVAKVLKKSPAEKAGVEESDVIKKVGKKEVKTVRELLSAVSRTEVGQKVKLEVIRDNKKVVLSVVIGERPEDLDEFTSSAISGGWRGLEVEGLSINNKRRFRIKEEQGVVVIDVERDSPADEAGIIPGDVILAINKKDVKNMSDYEKIVKGLKGDVLIRTVRGYFLLKENED